ncbi:MAG: hypothetical protein M1546_00320, partial [Chloroflexi bacterium]|nr:hypothetical protein [Chloroflexota bacterium]
MGVSGGLLARSRRPAVTRGPAPKPTALKVLAGNPGKRPLNGSEPQYPTELPTCPRPLSAIAKREGHR